MNLFISPDDIPETRHLHRVRREFNLPYIREAPKPPHCIPFNHHLQHQGNTVAEFFPPWPANRDNNSTNNNIIYKNRQVFPELIT